LKGTLALWFDKAAGETKPPSVELHFNLWRNSILQGSNFLDVGIRFLAAQNGCAPSNSVERFHLFIPGNFQTTEIEDLSVLMPHGSTLNAIFNEVVRISREHDLSFETTIRNNEPYLTFHRLSVLDDLKVQPVELSEKALGTVISFNSNFCKRCNTPGDHYLRFRILMTGENRSIFTTDTTPADWFTLSSFFRNELTEFRLNERRSFPDTVAALAHNFFDIQSVHYFLMREIRFELINAHTPFHKMRRLEEDLWRHYLRGSPPGSKSRWSAKKLFSRLAPKPMLIYHWKKERKDSAIEDFIALASFREPISNLSMYAIAIGALGAVGNAVYNLSLNGLASLGADVAAEQMIPLKTNLSVSIELALTCLNSRCARTNIETTLLLPEADTPATKIIALQSIHSVPNLSFSMQLAGANRTSFLTFEDALQGFF
jgi:hypothetical protein